MSDSDIVKVTDSVDLVLPKVKKSRTSKVAKSVSDKDSGEVLVDKTLTKKEITAMLKKNKD